MKRAGEGGKKEISRRKEEISANKGGDFSEKVGDLSRKIRENRDRCYDFKVTGEDFNVYDGREGR